MATSLEEQLECLSLERASGISPATSSDASKYMNDAGLEMQWAAKCWHQSETYFKLISSVDPSTLRLTTIDDFIFRQFNKKFKGMKIDIIDINDLKSEEAKPRWRSFCKMFELMIQDYSFASLLRKDTSNGYIDDNTILVARIQFYAIEIARNRRGLNNVHYKPQTSQTQTDSMTSKVESEGQRDSLDKAS